MPSNTRTVRAAELKKIAAPQGGGRHVVQHGKSDWVVVDYAASQGEEIGVRLQMLSAGANPDTKIFVQGSTSLRVYTDRGIAP